MYKIVQDYIDALNELADERERTAGLLEDCDKKTCMEVRDSALELLNNIFAEYEWSEEFVTAYAVYCNFFVLNGPVSSFNSPDISSLKTSISPNHSRISSFPSSVSKSSSSLEHISRKHNICTYNLGMSKLYYSDLEILSNLCGNKIESFQDILGGLAAMMHSEEGNQEKINYYIFFAEGIYSKYCLSSPSISFLS